MGRIRARRLALIWLAAVLVAGCGVPTDASLYVSNHSGATWYLAVDERSGPHLVAKVGDGAEGPVLEWQSGGDRTVSVLDAKCKKVGTLEVQPDGSFALPAVPGLTATIEAHAAPASARYAESLASTSDCGGEGYL